MSELLIVLAPVAFLVLLFAFAMSGMRGGDW